MPLKAPNLVSDKVWPAHFCEVSVYPCRAKSRATQTGEKVSKSLRLDKLEDVDVRTEQWRWSELRCGVERPLWADEANYMMGQLKKCAILVFLCLHCVPFNLLYFSNTAGCLTFQTTFYKLVFDFKMYLTTSAVVKITERSNTAG